MASISTNKKTGCIRIYFNDLHGGRKGLRVGKIKKYAQSMKLRVEEILQDQTFNRPHSSELVNWINGLPPAMKKKMVGVGLLDAAPPTMTVEELIKKFLAEADVKPKTSA